MIQSFLSKQVILTILPKLYPLSRYFFYKNNFVRIKEMNENVPLLWFMVFTHRHLDIFSRGLSILYVCEINLSFSHPFWSQFKSQLKLKCDSNLFHVFDIAI